MPRTNTPPLPSTGYNKPNANAPPVVNEMTFEKPELVRKIKKRSVNSRSSLIRLEAVGLTLEIQAQDLVTLEYCAT